MSIIAELESRSLKGEGIEKRISQYLLRNLQRMEVVTSTEVSKMIHTSQPTIVRFAQGLGYSGFTSFKFDLLKDINNVVNKSGLASDIGEEYSSLVPCIDKKTLTAFVEIISASNHVFICYPPELYNLTESIKDDFHSVGKLCIPLHYSNALLTLQAQLSGQDSVIFLPARSGDNVKSLASYIQSSEALLLELGVFRGGNSLPDLFVEIPRRYDESVNSPQMKNIISNIFFATIKYCQQSAQKAL